MLDLNRMWEKKLLNSFLGEQTLANAVRIVAHAQAYLFKSEKNLNCYV